jgi:hypothetical protein
MSFYTDIAQKFEEADRQRSLNRAGLPTIPSEVQQKIDQPGPVFDPFGRLADVYQQSFGGAADAGQLVAVPVNPQQASGGGVNLKPILILGALGVGGYFLYKRFAA